MFVRTHTPESFGDAILDILEDPIRRERLGWLALERVRTSLHWGLSSEVLAGAYEQVIQRSVPRVHHPEFERPMDMEAIYGNKAQID